MREDFEVPGECSHCGYRLINEEIIDKKPRKNQENWEEEENQEKKPTNLLLERDDEPIHCPRCGTIISEGISMVSNYWELKEKEQKNFRDF